MEILVFFDYKALAFFSCVILITASVLIYSWFYIDQSRKKLEFIKIIILFVISITILIFRPNIVSIILGWEGLGITSFILIIFYQNKKSLIRAIYTIIINRLGDIIILIRIINIINLNSWILTSTIFKNSQIILYIILIGAFSKRAQIPFSSWLTEAMAAPTPISALVHSSTLVTAGVYLVIRFELSIKYIQISKTIFIVRIITLIISRINSLSEWDIKKLIALSTLSQLRIIFITISINLFQLAFFHIIVHASFKALIFLCARSIISYNNTQDIRKIINSRRIIITTIRINTAAISLCGFPFISGFYSKDLIIELTRINNKRWILNLVFYICIAATIIYSIKIRIIITSKKRKTKHKQKIETRLQIIRKIVLLIPSIFLGNKISWIINLNFKIAQTGKIQKIIPIIIMITILIVIEKFLTKKILWKTKCKKLTLIKKLTNYMWFMKSIRFNIKNIIIINYFLVFKNREKGIFEIIINKTILIPIKIRTIWFIFTHKKFKNINLIILSIFLITIFLNSLNQSIILKILR